MLIRPEKADDHRDPAVGHGMKKLIAERLSNK